MARYKVLYYDYKRPEGRTPDVTVTVLADTKIEVFQILYLCKHVSASAVRSIEIISKEPTNILGIEVHK